MDYKTKHDAVRAVQAVRAKMPDGWKYKVWETSLGWRFNLQNGPATIWPCGEQYGRPLWCCMIGSTAETVGTGGVWNGEENHRHATPAAAFQAQYRLVLDHIAAEQRRFADLINALAPIRTAVEQQLAG